MLRKTQRLFEDWETTKDQLTLKQGGPTPFQLPIEIPGLASKYERDLNWEGNVVQSCVHCHQIGDAYRAWYRKKGEPIPQDLIYPMPDPKCIDITMEPKTGTTVKSLKRDGIGATAGLKEGDEISLIDGAPMASLADSSPGLYSRPQKSL
ncbi:MAG: hypothetical protein FJ308_19435 [Planctomycetes bacterium]|nr:hypothetical protein [Planctomycetota bacterium]